MSRSLKKGPFADASLLKKVDAMNAANEIAVAAFLEERCSYLGIAEVVEATMDACKVESVESIDQLGEVDAWARSFARSVLRK